MGWGKGKSWWWKRARLELASKWKLGSTLAGGKERSGLSEKRCNQSVESERGERESVCVCVCVCVFVLEEADVQQIRLAQIHPK